MRFALLLLLQIVRLSSARPWYEIDAESCRELLPTADFAPSDLQPMINEAFDMIENVLKLMETPEDFWDYRVADVFRALTGHWLLGPRKNSVTGVTRL